MKFFYFFCFAIALCAPAFGSSSEEFLDTRVQMMKEYLKQNIETQKVKTKFEAICPEHGDKFVKALLKVQEYAGVIEKSEETICSAVKNHLEKMYSPVVRVFEDCLPEKSKEVPSFLVKTLLSMTSNICKTDGEHIFEFSNPCVMTDNHRMRRCMLKTRSRLQQYSNAPPTKDEICEFLRSMRQCFKVHLDLSCGNQITREAFIGLFDSGLSHCDTPTEYRFNEIELVD